MPKDKVNDKDVIIKPSTPRYYHCFKLNESSYALFDIKMDMPLKIGSIALIKSMGLPPNSTVFYYKLGNNGYFEKRPEKTIKVEGEGKFIKPPLRYHYIDPKKQLYHHFKLSPILSVIFDDDFSMPISYGGNQKLQAVINKVNEDSSIFYYKEDATFKNSFKWWMTYDAKKGA